MDFLNDIIQNNDDNDSLIELPVLPPFPYYSDSEYYYDAATGFGEESSNSNSNYNSGDLAGSNLPIPPPNSPNILHEYDEGIGLPIRTLVLTLDYNPPVEAQPTTTIDIPSASPPLRLIVSTSLITECNPLINAFLQYIASDCYEREIPLGMLPEREELRDARMNEFYERLGSNYNGFTTDTNSSEESVFDDYEIMERHIRTQITTNTINSVFSDDILADDELEETEDEEEQEASNNNTHALFQNYIPSIPVSIQLPTKEEDIELYQHTRTKLINDFKGSIESLLKNLGNARELEVNTEILPADLDLLRLLFRLRLDKIQEHLRYWKTLPVQQRNPLIKRFVYDLKTSSTAEIDQFTNSDCLTFPSLMFNDKVIFKLSNVIYQVDVN